MKKTSEELHEQVSALDAEVASLKEELKRFDDEREIVAGNLALFDKLDLEAFNNRDMNLIRQIHADNVIVFNGDGTVTEGMVPKHEEELQFLFDTFDFKVTSHPVQFGDGPWTAGYSICEGTWKKPLKMPDGTVRQPNGKKFKVRIATLAKWKDGRIEEEHLFWDNMTWLQQIEAIP
jgi:hypothetical protein